MSSSDQQERLTQDVAQLAQQACDAARRAGAQPLVESIERRIQLYTSRTPYHEPAPPGTTSAPDRSIPETLPVSEPLPKLPQ